MHPLSHQRVGCVALQPADLHRFAFCRFAHADFFTQGFRGADAGAHAPHDVLGQDRLGRRFGRAGGDLTNEQRDVDIRGARGNAGGIMAEITPICRHKGPRDRSGVRADR